MSHYRLQDDVGEAIVPERPSARGWIPVGTTPRIVSEDGVTFREDPEWPGSPAAAQLMYECDCCERRNVPAKSAGIGYLCEDCLPSWTWDYGRLPEPSSVRPDHRAGRACPFRGEGKR